MTTIETTTGSKFWMGSIACSRHSISDLIQEIRSLLADKTQQPRSILCVNSHIYNLACKNERLRNALNHARVNAADGMAIVWFARVFGVRLPARCNMTEAYHTFLETDDFRPSTAIILGCSNEESRAAANRANLSSHCKVVASYSGYLSDQHYREIFQSHQNVDFIFIGMGTPKTEYVAAIAQECCPLSIVWGIGGGTIRIQAGTMYEAPLFFRRAGLQWLFRLFHDPKALWRRYLIGNPLFVFRILKARFGNKQK